MKLSLISDTNEERKLTLKILLQPLTLKETELQNKTTINANAY